MKKARAMNYACPDNVGIGVVGKFTGATVLNAERGAYMDIVSALDFSSLYPSIIRSRNMCYSTIVLDTRYDNLPDVEYYEIASDQGTYRFAQGVPSVLPNLLKDLAAFRKAAKKKMAEAKERNDSFMAALYNGSQNAFKVTMNSAYGFTGADKGFLSCVPIAASVTATGRLMIQKTKALVEQMNPGSRVVYGDSVAGYTPIIVRRDGKAIVTTIERVATIDGWIADGNKEYNELEDVDVWSDFGWTRVHRVIRHRCGKGMVRVLTHTGLVDVTEDHSLLRQDGSPVKPGDVNVGDQLLHFDVFPEFSCEQQITCVHKARVMGFFFGDGSCGTYGPTKYTWKLCNASKGMIELYLDLCSKAYPDVEFVAYDTIKSSAVYVIYPKKHHKTFAQEYGALMYSPDRNKVVPSCILGASREVRQAFWDGMYDANGDKDVHGYTRIDQKSQLSVATIFLLAASLGYKVSINTRRDKWDVFRLTCTDGEQRKDNTTIKKLEPFSAGKDTYVYDFTTSNHHFAAGVGKMVVHNTGKKIMVWLSEVHWPRSWFSWCCGAWKPNIFDTDLRLPCECESRPTISPCVVYPQPKLPYTVVGLTCR